MIETKYFCPFCAREMSDQNGLLFCERGDMTITSRSGRQLRACIEEQPFSKTKPPEKSDRTDGFCCRCGHFLNSVGSGRLCSACGLQLNGDIVRFLRDDHRHIGFKGIF